MASSEPEEIGRSDEQGLVLRVLAAHQPHYLPYPGVLSKLDAADIFVLRDTLQYTKQEWQNRNRIRTSKGWSWLTIPVHARHLQRINEIEVADGSWLGKHRRLFREHYRRCPFFEDAEFVWKSANLADLVKLADIAIRTTKELARSLGITTPILLESELEIGGESVASADLGLIRLCRTLGCDTYLSGDGAQCYIKVDRWRDADVDIAWHRCALEPYTQPYSGWVPNLSSMDLLACVADPLKHIRSSRKVWVSD